MAKHKQEESETEAQATEDPRITELKERLAALEARIAKLEADIKLCRR